jgi:hypothetical protein
MAKPNDRMQTSSYLRGIGILLLTFGVILGFIVLVYTFTATPAPLAESEASLGFLVSGCIVLLLSAYAKQVGEQNLGFWSIRNSFSRKLRRIVGIFLLVWAFVFYFPLPVWGSYAGTNTPNALLTLGTPIFVGLSGDYPSLSSGWIGSVWNFLNGNSIGYFTLIPFVAAGLVIMRPEVQSTLRRLNNEGFEGVKISKAKVVVALLLIVLVVLVFLYLSITGHVFVSPNFATP